MKFIVKKYSDEQERKATKEEVLFGLSWLFVKAFIVSFAIFAGLWAFAWVFAKDIQTRLTPACVQQYVDSFN